MTDSFDADSASARIAFLRGLRAVRQLRPDPLPDSVLHDILEVARWSGSAGNRQPWEFTLRPPPPASPLSFIQRFLTSTLTTRAGWRSGFYSRPARKASVRPSATSPVLATLGQPRRKPSACSVSLTNLCCARQSLSAIRPSTSSQPPIHQVASPSSSWSTGNITDVYAATARGLAPTHAAEFRSDAVYETLVDTNGDAQPDIVFQYTFTPKDANGNQFATALRTDVTGVGPTKDRTVSLAVNAPVSLTPEARTRIPATLQPDRLVQVDQMGRPGINTVFNHGNDKNVFNVTQPADQANMISTVAPTTGQSLLAVFQSELQALSEGSPKGQYTADQALSIAKILLPDVLTYDYSSAAGYLNGRRLQDDVIDISLNLVTNGKITGDGVSAHTDYLAEFPYVGRPHA